MKRYTIWSQKTQPKNQFKLQEREKADFIRMKKDMIHRVNIAATEFRKMSDQQVPPTIKRAIRENQQVQSALKKMEINCRGGVIYPNFRVY